MSASCTKQTSVGVASMSAFGGKAGIHWKVMSAFDPKRTLDRQPRQVAAPTALNFGVLKSVSVTKTYGGSFEYLVSRIRNGVEHNDENDRENDRGNAGQYEWLHDDGPPFSAVTFVFILFLFPDRPNATTRQHDCQT